MFAISGLTFATEINAEEETTTTQPTYFEAESVLAKYTTVEMDIEASGRMYVDAVREEQYMPLVIVPLPESFEKITIWARIRGGSQVLKTTVNGKAVDLQWKHRNPSTWTWVNFGTYEKSELGSSVRLVRAPGGAGGVDAIFLDTTNTIDPRESENLKSYEAK
ncbi:hypothetical protein [Puniceicoccus vermicola]|nr:hypothetical protein [Puniceicoccus vermicola]